MENIQAELSRLGTLLEKAYQDLGATDQARNRAPSRNEMAASRLEINRATRKSVWATVMYVADGTDGKPEQMWRMLANTPDKMQALEAAKRHTESYVKLAQMQMLAQATPSAGSSTAGPSASTPLQSRTSSQVAGSEHGADAAPSAGAAEHLISSPVPRISVKRRLSQVDTPGDGQRPSPSPSPSSPGPSSPEPRFLAQLREDALAATFEKEIPSRLKTALLAMAEQPAQAYKLLGEILRNGADSGAIDRRHADALGLSDDRDYRFIARQVGGAPVCLLMAGTDKTLPAGAKSLERLSLGKPVVMRSGSAVPAWLGEKRIFLHLVQKDQEIVGVRVLADMLHTLEPGDPDHSTIRSTLYMADVIDTLYPPRVMKENASRSDIERALRKYDVAEALRLLLITPAPGTHYEVDFRAAAQACNKAIASKDLDALCAILVVQPRGFAEKMQAATNALTGRSLRDDAMELATKLNYPELRKYLKQFPYPYHSKEGDFRVRLNTDASYSQEGYAGDPITCRDLATAWLLERMNSSNGKVDYAKFSSVEALEKLDAALIHLARRRMFATASERHLVHPDRFGEVLEHLFENMENAPSAARQEKHFFIVTDTHVMAGACSFRNTSSAYRAVVYDPNATATHKAVTASSRSTVMSWRLSSLHLHNHGQYYHAGEEKIIGVHVLANSPMDPSVIPERPLPSSMHHNRLHDMSSPDWINRVTPSQAESMLANGLHEEWKLVMESLSQAVPMERVKGLLSFSSRAAYNKLQVLDFVATLRTYIQTIGNLPMLDQRAKFSLISNAGPNAAKDDYPTSGFLAAYLDEVMKLPLSEESKVRLVMSEVQPQDADVTVPYLHVLAQRLRSNLVQVYLDHVPAMPISDANKLKILAAADSNGRTAIIHPIDEDLPALVKSFIDAIMPLNAPDEDKAAAIFNFIPGGIRKEQVLAGVGLPETEPNVPRLLHDALAQLSIPDADKNALFIPQAARGDSGSDDSERLDAPGSGHG